MSDPAFPVRPFRWDLVGRDQLGSLLDDVPEPNLWFLDELTVCAARVLARSADGDVYFVGRSPDSIYDLLSGALADTAWAARIHQLPLSVRALPDLSRAEIRQLRANLSAAGLAPHALARRRRPVVFTDLVYLGYTYGNLYALLRDWIDEEGAQWDVIRLKLRFLGITWREKTSPKTWRWHQHADWTKDLPPRAIANISLDGAVWGYLGNGQHKLTDSFHPRRWTDEEAARPKRDDDTRAALAEAVALVEAGGSDQVRRDLRRHLTSEPAIAEPWLRSLVHEL